MKTGKFALWLFTIATLVVIGTLFPSETKVEKTDETNGNDESYDTY